MNKTDIRTTHFRFQANESGAFFWLGFISWFGLFGKFWFSFWGVWGGEVLGVFLLLIFTTIAR